MKKRLGKIKVCELFLSENNDEIVFRFWVVRIFAVDPNFGFAIRNFIFERCPNSLGGKRKS